MSARPLPLTFNDVDLLYRFCNHLRNHLDRGFDDELNLSLNEVQILLHAAQNEGECRPSTATGLEEFLALQGRSTKHLVEDLRKSGLLEEDTNSPWRDNRRKQLRVTQKGKDRLNNVGTTWQHIADGAFPGTIASHLRDLAVALRELQDAPIELRRRFVDPT